MNKMSKLTSKLFKAVAFACVFAPFGAYAEWQIGNLFFSEPDNNGEVSVTRCVDGVESVAIPASVTYSWTEWYYNDRNEWVSRERSRLCPVTKIGTVAFLNGVIHFCGLEYITSRGQNLSSVSIPDSVRSIGEGAFAGCSNLRSVVIPGSVTNILTAAFENTSLETVDLPEGVVRLGGRAFGGCDGLQYVAIPTTLRHVGEYIEKYSSDGGNVFGGCTNIASVNIKDLDAWCKIEFLNNTSNPLFYCGNLMLNGSPVSGSVIVPDGVSMISPSAFYGCEGITSISIPDTVTNVCSYAFYGCANLTELVFPDKIERIGECALYGCVGIKELSVPKSVQYIEDSAFCGCGGLESITIPFIGNYRGGGLYSVFGRVFGTTAYDGGTMAYQHYDTFASSSPYNVYTGYADYCIPTALRKVTVTDETGIPFGAFSNCKNLTDISIAGDIQVGYAFDTGYYKYYGGECFAGCTSLTNVALPSCLVAISEKMFLNCTAIERVDIPGNVEVIREDAFYGCSKLADVPIPCGVQKIEDSAFRGCSSLTDLNLPNALENIGSSAFSDCRSLTSVHTPASLTTIGGWAFSGCTNLVDVALDEGIGSIGDYAFYSCTALDEIVVPNSVTNIGWGAFLSCESLRRVFIHGVKIIRSGVFQDLKNLELVELGDGVEKLTEWAFSGCTNLKDVTVPGSVGTIEAYVFAGCSSLTNVVVKEGVNYIWNDAFRNCSRLESITMPSSLQKVWAAFNGCTGLRRVCVSDLAAWCRTEFVNEESNPLKIASEGLYLNGEALSGTLTIPDGVTDVGVCAFAHCGGIEDITFPASTTNIGRRAFANCAGFTRIFIPASIEGIGEGAFENCAGLQTVYLPSSLKDSGVASTAFYNCPSSLQKIYYDPPLTFVKVTLDATGGMVGTGAIEVAVNTPIGALPTPRRDGFGFQGWFTAKDGGNEVTRETIVTESQTFYAHWERIYQFANTGLDGEIWEGTAINECNLDFMIPATDELPEGAKIRIRKIRFASNNSSFVDWDSTNNKSDPYFVRLNGVNSDKYEFTGTIASNAQTEDRAISYTFSSPCDVIVGKRYPAVTGNNIGGKGSGIAFLYSNGKLVYGSGADRASVRYVKMDESESVVTTDTATSITGEAGYCPVYEIEAEIITLESSILDEPAFDWTVTSTESNIKSISGGWFNGATTFENATLGDVDLRIGPGSECKYARQTISDNFPWRNVSARNGVFSFALYADASAVPNEGKALLLEFGNLYSQMAILYRDGDEVCFCIGTKDGAQGTIASVDLKPGYHLYCATCNPLTGEVSLSCDGASPSHGSSGGEATLGYGFQIGSIFNGIDGSAFVKSPNLAIVKLLGYDDELSQKDMVNLSSKYPADESAVCDVLQSDLTGKTLTVAAGQMARVVVTDDQDEAGWTPSNIRVKECGRLVFVTANGNILPASRISINGETVSLLPRPPVQSGVDAGENDVSRNEDGSYTVTAAGESDLTDGDIVVWANYGGDAVDVTVGYEIEINGKTAIVRLKAPEIGQDAAADGVESDSDDPAGVLVVVPAEHIRAMPVVQTGESLGALPVKSALKGLWYQASWGNDLNSLMRGEKIQSDGEALYLGVIRQKGSAGFYGLSVSEN